MNNTSPNLMGEYALSALPADPPQKAAHPPIALPWAHLAILYAKVHRYGGVLIRPGVT